MTIYAATVPLEIARPISKRLGRVDDGGHGAIVEKRLGDQLIHNRCEFEAVARTSAEYGDAWNACISRHDKALVWGVRVHADAGFDHIALHFKQTIVHETLNRVAIRIMYLCGHR